MKKLIMIMAVALTAATGAAQIVCVKNCYICHPKNKTEEAAKKAAAQYSNNTDSQADINTYIVQQSGDSFRVIVYDINGTGWDASKGLNKTFRTKYDAWGYAYSLALKYKDESSQTVSTSWTISASALFGPIDRLSDESSKSADWKTIDYRP